MEPHQNILRLRHAHTGIPKRTFPDIYPRAPLFGGNFQQPPSQSQPSTSPSTKQPAPQTGTHPANPGSTGSGSTGTGGTGTGGTGTGGTGTGGTGTGGTGTGGTGGGTTPGGGSTGSGGSGGAGSILNPQPDPTTSPSIPSTGEPSFDLPSPSGGVGTGTNHDTPPSDNPAPSTPGSTTPSNSSTTNPSTPPPANSTATNTTNATSAHNAAAPTHTKGTNSTDKPAKAPLPTNDASNATAPPVVTQIITTLPTSTPTPDPTISSSDSSDSSAGGAQIGVIIGAIAGGLAGVIVLIWLILIPVRRRQTRQKEVDWALAFDNDHGPSGNSADAVFGNEHRRRNSAADDLRAVEKSDPYVMGDMGRGQMEYVQGDVAMQGYQQYHLDAANGSQQWLDPHGQAYAGGQDFVYDPQGQAYFNGAPNNVDPYTRTSPTQGPTAYYGWPADVPVPGSTMSPPPQMNTPLFSATVQRGYSTSTRSTAVSPAQGPMTFKGHAYPPQGHFNGQDPNCAYPAGTGTAHSEYGGGGGGPPSEITTTAVASDIAAEQCKQEGTAEDDIYGGVTNGPTVQ
ncbi:hypothetical protein CF319_g3295 [Tilletia indica]|nr:hypothetical protein CF319_g3295 [Tilletia indica]